MEFKNIERVLSIIDSVDSFKHPLLKSWPIPPVYHLAELKKEKIENWEGKFEARHKQTRASLDSLIGSVKYKEKARIGEEDIEVELKYYSVLEKYIKLPTGMRAIIPIQPFELKAFVDMLYSKTSLPPIKSENISEIQAKIDVKNEYNPNVPIDLSKWSVAKYYPEICIKMGNERLILKYSVVWDTSTIFPKFDFYPKRKVLIKHEDFQTETDDEEICNMALQLLSSYVTIKGNLASQKSMKLKVNGNETSINEYIDKIALDELTKVYRGVVDEINFIHSELKLLKPNFDSKYEQIVSLYRRIKSSRGKGRKEINKERLPEISREIKAAFSPRDTELTEKVMCYAYWLSQIKANEETFAWLGCRETNKKYAEISSLISKELVDEVWRKAKKIRRVQWLLHSEKEKLKKYLIELEKPSYIM
jgi:hypothetical protein